MGADQRRAWRSREAVWCLHRTADGARLVKLEPGAALPVSGRGVYLVLSGAGNADGQPLRKFTTVFLDTGESGTLRGSEATELLHYGLPDLSDLEVGMTGAAIEAAE